jgi:hypothetical protein
MRLQRQQQNQLGIQVCGKTEKGKRSHEKQTKTLPQLFNIQGLTLPGWPCQDNSRADPAKTKTIESWFTSGSLSGKKRSIETITNDGRSSVSSISYDEKAEPTRWTVNGVVIKTKAKVISDTGKSVLIEENYKDGRRFSRIISCSDTGAKIAILYDQIGSVIGAHDLIAQSNILSKESQRIFHEFAGYK